MSDNSQENTKVSQTRKGRPTKELSDSNKEYDSVFLGVRISKDTHQRLYRAKARLEFDSGEFYGMGKLVEQVLSRGLDIIEKEIYTTKD